MTRHRSTTRCNLCRFKTDKRGCEHKNTHREQIRSDNFSNISDTHIKKE